MNAAMSSDYCAWLRIGSFNGVSAEMEALQMGFGAKALADLKRLKTGRYLEIVEAIDCAERWTEASLEFGCEKGNVTVETELRGRFRSRRIVIKVAGCL